MSEILNFLAHQRRQFAAKASENVIQCWGRSKVWIGYPCFGEKKAREQKHPTLRRLVFAFVWRYHLKGEFQTQLELLQ